MTKENDELEVFKPADFELCKDELSNERMIQRAAHLANLRLKEIMKDAPRYYFYRDKEFGRVYLTDAKHDFDTHSCQFAPWTLKEIGK